MNAQSIMISAEGENEPKGHHLVIVDGRCALIDLSTVAGTLHDPSIKRVEWGSVQDGATARPGGFITRTDGSRTPFFDKQAVLPYAIAFDAEWRKRLEVAS